MAEPYSDEQFLRWSEMMPSETEEDSLAARWAATVRRLMRERDKARHVAVVLAGPAKHLKILGHDLTADELKAIDAALAYPEVKRP